MKIALLTRAIHPLHGRGGLERHTAALKRYLERAGCDVRVFTTPPDQELSEPRDETYTFTSSRMLPWPRRPGFVVLERNTNYLIWSVRAARELIGSFEPDIVQADGGAGFGYAVLGAEKHAPLVLHPHGMEEFKTTALKRAAYFPLRNAIRYAASRAARVIAPDRSMKVEVLQLLGVEPDKIAVIPNAIDIEEIDRRPDGDVSVLELDARDTVLLSVGRLEANKGFVDLANALGEIRDEMPEHWKWVLVGEGLQRETIERVVNERGLAPKTSLVGSVSDEQLHALYKRANLFVHPTRYEGSSMVTLEAMAHSKPVIATRVGGIPDKIVDGVSGILVPPADVDALARTLAAAVTERDMLAEWGHEGRRIAEQEFSWSTRIHELLELYGQLQ